MKIKKYKPSSHKVKAVVYGASGCGKTTFGASAPKPIFASAEGGLLSIAHLEPDYAEIKTLKDLSELYEKLKDEDHGFETLIIDSITEVNDIIKIDIEKKTGKQMTIKDWGTLGKKIKSILRQFRDLNMHVLFICQEKESKDEDRIHKILPSLNGKADTEIAYFMDIVGYLYIDKKGDRRMITQPSAKLLTKDRTNKIGNDAAIDLGSWVNLVKNIKIEKKAPKKAEKEEVEKETAPAETKAETPKKEEKKPEKKEPKKPEKSQEEATPDDAKKILAPERTKLQDYCMLQVGYDETKDKAKYCKKANEYISEKFKEELHLGKIDEEKSKLLLTSLLEMGLDEIIDTPEFTGMEKTIDECKTKEELFALKAEVKKIKKTDLNEYNRIVAIWLDKRKTFE